MLYEILQLRFCLNMVYFTKKKWQNWKMKIPEKYDWKVKAFLLFLHKTKSIDVSFDNISIEIISERKDFILDQCAVGAM